MENKYRVVTETEIKNLYKESQHIPQPSVNNTLPFNPWSFPNSSVNV